MYEYIQGKIEELTPAYVVIDVGGVGYCLHISLRTYTEIERRESARVYVHQYYMRDGLPVAYGFANTQERDVFRMLVGVSGVGGNTARMILSTYSAKELSGIISTENAGLLKNVKGLGIKTAQKIIVELKDKIVGGISPSSAQPAAAATTAGAAYDEALAALMMLGFTRGASDKALRSLLGDHPDASVEELVRLALKKL